MKVKLQKYDFWHKGGGDYNVPEIPWHLLKSREANPMRWEWLITWGCLEFDGDPRLPFGGCAKLLRRGR